MRAVLLLAVFLFSFPLYAAAPAATTSAATAITTSSADLNGAGTPNGEATTGWFRISATDPGTCDDVFGTRVPAVGGTDLGTGNASVPYSINATGLTSGVTYYFCSIVENASGQAFGSVLSFTVPGAPSVSTTGSSSVTSTGATLEAAAAPNASATTGWFRYSATDPGSCNDTFGTRAPTSGGSSLGSGSSAVSYTRTISGLIPGETYFYCAIAQNALGTSFGSVLSFTALAEAPAVTTSNASLITGATAQLNGAGNPGGALTTGWFRFSTTNPGTCDDAFGTRAPTTGGSDLGSGNSSVAYGIGVTGLSAGTTYYYCAIAENSVGKSFGAIVSFTTPSPPTVTTVAATNLTNSSARLQGTGTPNGASTSAWFRFSATDPGTCNDTFGSRAPTSGGTSLGSGSSAVNYNRTISGLSAGTTYYYCALASNSEGLRFGTVLSFTTAAAPSVTTEAPTNVTSTSVSFNGSANPNSNNAYGFFRFSTTNPGTCNNSFGTRWPTSTGSDTFLGSGNSGVSFSRTRTSLVPGTTYYYCALARNSYGTSFGTVMSFTTEAALPSVSTNTATLLTGTTANLRGSANPGGATATGWFRYATTSPGSCNDSFGTRAPTTGGTDLGSGNASVAFNEGISGLTAGTTYYFCAIAQNSVGTSFGIVRSFTTPLPPTVTTNAASSLTNSSARLNGSGVPNGSSTTGWYRYSATDPGTCNDTFGSRVPTTGGVSLGSGYNSASYNRTASGLTAGTTYYFCAIVSSAEGTAFGAVLSFTTADAPAVTTVAASTVTSNAATFNGSAIPNSNNSYGFFRYSTTNPGTCSNSFGIRWPSSSGSDTFLGSGSTAVAFSRNRSGLQPGTTYYFCALARNSYGTRFGTVMSFTTDADLPSVTTSTANLLTGTTANLRGSADPGGATTSGWFRYATTSPGTCNDTFGTRAPTTGGTALGAGTSSVAFNEGVSGLSPATTYYFCAIAENVEGKAFGILRSFTTPTPPSVTTNAATSVTNGSARLNGAANPQGSSATGWFRFSLTDPVTCNDSFGSRAPATGGTSLGSGTNSVNYNRTISGLSAGTTYYYCAIASSAEGTAFGAVLSLTTADAPTVTTAAPSSITSTSVVFNGSGTPNNNTAYGFFRFSTTNPGACTNSFGTRWPTSTSQDTNLGSGDSAVSFSRTRTSLVPGTTYYYCALARNAYGTAFGAVLSFTTEAALPSVSTSTATLLTGTTANLRGSANPGGDTTTGWFRYATASPGSCNDSFGTRAPTTGGTALGSGNASVAFNEGISGLTAGTTYYFCAIANNSVGTSFGIVRSFTTPLPPTVATAAATSLTNTSARLNGVGVPNGSSTTGWFRYSATDPGTCNDTFGSRVPTTSGTSLGSGTSNVSYNRTATGLTAGTTYFFCAIVSSAEGTAFGSVLSFTTADAPDVTTLAATSIASSSARFNGSATPNSNNSYGFFRYSTTDPGTCSNSFGSRSPTSSGSDTFLGAGSSAVSFSRSQGALQPGTTYYYCALARNSYGTRFGTVMSFTTDADLPSVTTSSATLLTGTTANLRGSADPGGASTAGWFRYATTSPGTCNDTFGTRAPTTSGNPLGSGTSSVAYNEGIAGLTPGTTYYFCAIAENSEGKGFGSLRSFSTPTPPSVTTNAATNLTNTGARLQGSGIPNGASTTGWFRFSLTDPGTCNDTFGSRAPTSGGTSLGSGTSSVNYNRTISGLSAGTTYYYCAIASSAEGTAFGSVLSFTTADAPTVTTLAATNITSNSVRFNGSANPNSNNAYGFFRFSTTNPGACNSSFGTRWPSSSGSDTFLGSGASAVSYSRTRTSLSPGTTYFYCALSRNSYGTSFGAVMSFTTPAALPTVSTSTASSISTMGATLRGVGNPGGDAAVGWFRYGTASPGTCNDSFGTRAPSASGSSLGSGTSSVSFSQVIAGLTPGTTYYFCAIAENAVGKAFGNVRTFTTTSPPSVSTFAATPVTATTATLNASVNPNSFATTGWFRFDTTDPGACSTTFGTSTSTSSIGSGTTAVALAKDLTGLSPATTYYFCAIATSSTGTTLGAVLSFTTPAAPPSVTTVVASDVLDTSAVLNGTANPNGSMTTGWFRYSATNPGTCNDSFGTRAPTTGGADLGGGNTVQNFAMPVSSLTAGTTYYYCALASSPIGNSVGTVMSFTTPQTPTVASVAASSVSSTSATLNGSADPNNGATTGWFRYSATDPGTCNDAFGTRAPAAGGTSLGAGATAVPYTEAVVGLTPATTYYYCAIASNAVGTGLGTVLSFTTTSAPSVTTAAATLVTSDSATLNGSANPNASAATGWFRYSATDPGTCDDTFGTRAPTSGGTALGAGGSAVAFSRPLTGLAAGTTYYACAIAENGVGTAFGSVVSFTTPAAPSVTSLAATAVGTNAATLNGSANPNLEASTGWFRYSITNPGTCNDTFGTRAPTTGGAALGSGGAAVGYAQPITGLAPATTYYFCAIAQNAVGSSFGTVLSVTTTSAPTIATAAATSVSSASAVINGSGDPNNAPTDGWFRYSETDPGACNDSFGTRAPATGGTALGSGSTPVAFSETLNGLTGSTTYFFCAIGQNSVGLDFGAVLSFTTTAAPSVTTAAATLVTSTTATLNGSANPNLDATTGWFRYGATDPGACDDTFGTRLPATGGTSLGAGSTDVSYGDAVSGLAPGTTYYFCAIADNAAGTSFGLLLNFTTPAAPSVTSAAATLVTSTSATLNGSANPNNGAASGWFRYGTTDPGTCNDTFGTRAPTTGGATLGSGSSDVAYTQAISGLTSGTTYYFCAIASNTVGTRFGSVLSFTTTAAPSVTSSAATLVTGDGATLNGSANPNLNAATGWFRYSDTDPGACDDTFGTRAPMTGGTALGAGSTAVAYSEALVGLSPGTTYYFCAIADNAAGPAFGALLSFTTTSAPAVSSMAAASVTDTTATINGSANPNTDAASGWFRYSATDPGSCNDSFGTRAPTSGGTNLGAGNSAVAFSESLTGLSAGTTYYFCAIADNSVGTGFGSVLSFTTADAPTVTSEAALASSTGATLNGTANPNRLATTGWFRYDTTDPGTCDDTFGTRAPLTGGTSLGNGETALPFSEVVVGLMPATTYYYCAIAENAAGTRFGLVRSLFTSGAPMVTTDAAADVTTTTATVNGTANPNLLSSEGWFRYDTTDPGTCDDSFGTRAPAVGGTDLGASDIDQPYSEAITALLPGTTYYVCAIAENADGTAFGEVESFTTEPDAPVVETDAPSDVEATTATLNGAADPNGAATTGWFRYDTTDPGTCDDTFGVRAPNVDGTALGDVAGTAVTYSEAITGLTPGATYYYCAIAENTEGMGFGPVVMFVAGADAPTVTTDAASDILATTATIAGTANPNGSDTVAWFRYSDVDPGSCDDAFGTRVPDIALADGFDALPFTHDLADLEPSTTYYYCASASNLGGAAFGDVLTFTTLGPPPEVTTVPAIQAGGAVQLNGEANPQGTETTAWFRYDTVAPDACDDAFGTRTPDMDGTVLGDGTDPVDFSETLSALAAGTYYFCAIGESSNGLGYGEVLTFEVTEEAPPDEEIPEDSDCSCHIVGSTDRTPSKAWLLALLGLAALRRRRSS